MIRSTFFKIFIALAGVGGGAYFIYKKKDSISRWICENVKKTIEHEPEVSVVDFPTDSFVKDIAKFSGTLEPLYNAVNQKTMSDDEKEYLMQDFTLRFMSTEGRDAFLEWKNAILSKGVDVALNTLLSEIMECGIKRDDRTEIIVDESTSKTYINWSGENLMVGERMRVASVCWTYNGICVEKGILTKQETNNYE